MLVTGAQAFSPSYRRCQVCGSHRADGDLAVAEAVVKTLERERVAAVSHCADRLPCIRGAATRALEDVCS